MLSLLLAKLKCKIYPCMDVRDNSSVTHLLEDRLEIAELLNGHDVLKRWLVEQFSGKTTKFPILWDPNEPNSGYVSEYHGPIRKEPAKIRVSRNISGLEQLSTLVYELFNISNHKRHNLLWKKACNGMIGKQEYGFQSCRLEYKAWKKCRRFFKKHPSVFAVVGDSILAHNVVMSATSFPEYFAFVKKESGGETYYEKMYEERIVPHLEKKRNRSRSS
jgi:hypothetical protein